MRQSSRTSGVGSDGPGCVVVGWDQSMASERALAYATGLARRSAGRLLAVSVQPTVPASDWYGFAALAEVERSGAVAMPAEPAADLNNHLPKGWRAVTAYGEVAATLAEIADEARADVIVVGRSAHPFRHPFGTVAQRLLRRARRPVVVVP